MCCGRKRVASGASRVTAGPRPSQITFQYTGSTGLTVTGTPSGASYRFDHQGARLIVDARDRAALGRIPVLRLVG